MLNLLKERGNLAQEEILHDGDAPAAAEQQTIDLAAAVAMAARRAVAKADRPAAKRAREPRQAPSALAKRRAKLARKEVSWAEGYEIPRLAQGDGDASEECAALPEWSAQRSGEDEMADVASEPAYDDIDVFITSPPVEMRTLSRERGGRWQGAERDVAVKAK